MRIPKGEKEENEADIMFEEVITNKFQNLWKWHYTTDLERPKNPS